MIRKAEKNGLIYRADYEFESMEEFKRLYTNTMHRLNAEDFYLFDDKYYDSIKREFHDRVFIGAVEYNNTIISSALFMICGNYGHYHLSGSNREYSGLGANNYLLWNTILELKKHNVNWFHLGGGSDSDPDNSLLKFKKSFKVPR